MDFRIQDCIMGRLVEKFNGRLGRVFVLHGVDAGRGCANFILD